MSRFTGIRNLSKLNAGEHVTAAAERLIRSGASMQALLDDLVDFNRTRLGLGVRIARSDIDLAMPVRDEIEQLRGANPTREIELTVSGDCRGQWDGLRVQQAVRNLVCNAVQYGAPDTPVRVALRGEAAAACLEVTNSGLCIDPAKMNELFDPLRRDVDEAAKADRGNLGLGLFIVREIARAHGGEVEVRSDGGETSFTLRLPRQNAKHPDTPDAGRTVA